MVEGARPLTIPYPPSAMYALLRSPRRADAGRRVADLALNLAAAARQGDDSEHQHDHADRLHERSPIRIRSGPAVRERNVTAAARFAPDRRPRPRPGNPRRPARRKRATAPTCKSSSWVLPL